MLTETFINLLTYLVSMEELTKEQEDFLLEDARWEQTREAYFEKHQYDLE